MIGQNLDVTVQKHMELALAEANERVRQVLANSPILSYSCVPVARSVDPWDYTYISERSRDILGMEPAEVVANSPRWLDRIHPADRERVQQMLNHLGDMPSTATSSVSNARVAPMSGFTISDASCAARMAR